MPLYHCKDCHHEWESTDKREKCDWCGADGYVIDDKTPLSKLLDNMDNILKHLIKED